MLIFVPVPHTKSGIFYQNNTIYNLKKNEKLKKKNKHVDSHIVHYFNGSLFYFTIRCKYQSQCDAIECYAM